MGIDGKLFGCISGPADSEYLSYKISFVNIFAL